MKPLLFALLILLVACDASGAPSTLPPSVQLGADAIAANQSAQTAQARSNALSAQATAVKQSTRDAQDARATDAAIQIAFANVTATAESEQYKRADVAKTESAIGAATYVSASATHLAQTAVAVAAATGTRERELAATATATAQEPTRLFIAQQARDEQERRARERALNQTRYQQELQLAPLLRTVELVTPTCLAFLVFGALALAIGMVGIAARNWINAHTFRVNAEALAGVKVITDAYGNPIGYLRPVRGAADFYPIEYEDLPPPDLPTVAPGILRDAAEAPKAIAAPAEPLVGDFVYPSTLRAFTQAILDENDWTQARWRDKVLPRGYVMSADTKDKEGRNVPGGYSRLMQLYVDRHLIIHRRAGTTGIWNPNAPREIEGVMDILENKAPLPSVQEVAAPVASPAPPRRRAKKAVAQLG